MRRPTIVFVRRVTLCSVLLFLACSSGGEDGANGSANKSGSGSGGSSGISTGGAYGIANPSGSKSGNGTTGAEGQPIDCEGGEDRQGCTCEESGKERECWPGAPGESDKGVCRPGKQHCVANKDGEFTPTSWGPCTGYNLPSDGCTPGEGSGGTGVGSGGMSSSGGATSSGGAGGYCVPWEDPSDWNPDNFDPRDQPNGPPVDKTCPGTDCRCVPDGVRWCDEPVFCNWGGQKCLPNGEWGPCSEVMKAPAGCENSGRVFDLQCCIEQGNCCEDPATHRGFGNCTSQCQEGQAGSSGQAGNGSGEPERK